MRPSAACLLQCNAVVRWRMVLPLCRWIDTRIEDATTVGQVKQVVVLGSGQVRTD